MEWISVGEAAEELGVSERRVRQLAKQGVLAASRIGKSWAIERNAVHRRSELGSHPGRPYSHRKSWRMAGLADFVLEDHGGKRVLVEIKHVSPGEEAKERWQSLRSLRNLMAHGDLDAVAAMLRSRSNRIGFYFAHRSLIRKIGMDARLVISGAKAAESFEDLIADESLEAYVRASDLPKIQSEYGLQKVDSSRANLLLRIVADDLNWDARLAPLLLVIADLRERGDARADKASEVLFDRFRNALEPVK